MINYMTEVIGPPPRKNVIPGHSIAEEALVNLYRLFVEVPGLKREMPVPVDEVRYLRLAEFFIEARGHHEGRKSFDFYGQDHKSVFEQESIEGHAVRATLIGGGFQARIGQGAEARPVDVEAIPYFAYGNRGQSDLRVWLPERREDATPETLASGANASASHCWGADPVAAIHDGVVPATSRDTSVRRLSWWDHKGTREWAQLDFPRPAQVSRVRVFWFADRPAKGGCDLPASWRLLYCDGKSRGPKREPEWKPVEKASDYGIVPDRFNEVRFTPVTVTGLRLEVQLEPGWSGGISEWEVE